jgi:hypothetical protein
LPYTGAATVVFAAAGAAAVWPILRLLRADPLKALRMD